MTHKADGVPLSCPDITDAEREAVLAVLRSPRLSIGPRVEAFGTALPSTPAPAGCTCVSEPWASGPATK